MKNPEDKDFIAEHAGRAPRWGGCASLVIVGVLTLVACTNSSEDDGGNDAGLDATAEASTGCPSLLEPPPGEGSTCSEPGLVCDVGSLSCWRKVTCQSDLRWHVTCGIVFPDGGPCC